MAFNPQIIDMTSIVEELLCYLEKIAKKKRKKWKEKRRKNEKEAKTTADYISR